MFRVLMKVKADVLAAEFSPAEVGVLRRVALFASGGDEGRVTGLEALAPDRATAVQRVASTIQSIAIQVSQLSFYKSSFSSVIGGWASLVCRCCCCLVGLLSSWCAWWLLHRRVCARPWVMLQGC